MIVFEILSSSAFVPFSDKIVPPPLKESRANIFEKPNSLNTLRQLILLYPLILRNIL